MMDVGDVTCHWSTMWGEEVSETSSWGTTLTYLSNLPVVLVNNQVELNPNYDNTGDPLFFLSNPKIV